MRGSQFSFDRLHLLEKLKAVEFPFSSQYSSTLIKIYDLLVDQNFVFFPK